jgi:acyl-CoA synthetase (AMP-forming)/AMP-acid ligase II
VVARLGDPVAAARFGDLVVAGPDGAAVVGGPGSRDGEVLQLTSGSTGEPRIARQPLRNLVRGGDTYRRLFGLTSADVVVAGVPLAHSFGLIGGLIAAVLAGASLRTLDRFNPRQLVAALTDTAAGPAAAGLAAPPAGTGPAAPLPAGTTLLGTPLVYRLLVPVLGPGGRPGRLRTALSSGGPLPEEVAAAAAGRLGVPVWQIYGSTELGLIACEHGPDGSGRPGSVGFPAPGVRLRLAPGDAEVPGAGRLQVRSRTMFLGYLGAPDDPAWTEDGWYDTGDVGRFDQDGRLWLLGRKDTFINVGGRKVNPRRIERILAEHAAVREVAVYRKPGPGGEEEIGAALVLTPGGSVADVVGFCRARGLQPYEVPHHVSVLPALPRTGMGKVDRGRLPGVAGPPAAEDRSGSER